MPLEWRMEWKKNKGNDMDIGIRMFFNKALEYGGLSNQNPALAPKYNTQYNTPKYTPGVFSESWDT